MHGADAHGNAMHRLKRRSVRVWLRLLHEQSEGWLWAVHVVSTWTRGVLALRAGPWHDMWAMWRGHLLRPGELAGSLHALHHLQRRLRRIGNTEGVLVCSRCRVLWWEAFTVYCILKATCLSVTFWVTFYGRTYYQTSTVPLSDLLSCQNRMGYFIRKKKFPVELVHELIIIFHVIIPRGTKQLYNLALSMLLICHWDDGANTS